MKSEKAKEVLARSYDGGHICMENAERAVELAEQEAEERMREKAIKAHRACCPLNELQCIHRDRDDYTCTYDCRCVTSFVQKLTEE